MDFKINDYLIGLFYVLKMPTSNYIIRRFFDHFVLIETDVFFFSFNRMAGFVHFKFLSYFLMTKFTKFAFICYRSGRKLTASKIRTI